MKKLLSLVIALVFGLTSFLALAKPIFLINVNPMILNLTTGATGTFSVSVTNNSGTNFPSGMNYTANILSSPLFTSSISASTCTAALNQGQTCSFTINVQAGNIAGTGNLAPRACFLQEACSSLEFPNYAFVIISGGAAQLTSIAISPLNRSIGRRSTVQYRAIGTYRDGSTADITSAVSWNSSNVAVATINASGLATGISAGTTTISARLGAVTSNSTTLRVLQQFAYVANALGGNISQCSIDPNTGSLSNCNALATPSFFSPRDIILNNSGTFAYVANFGANNVQQCSINPNTGALNDDCTIQGSGFAGPQSLGFNAAGTFLYFLNIANSVVVCAVDPNTGGLSGCHATGSGFSAPTGIAFNSSGTLAYVGNQAGNTVSKCTVASGDLVGCVDSGGTGFNGIVDLVMDPTGNFLYVTNTNGNDISKCDINQNTGNLSNCVSAAAITSPTGIALNIEGNFIYIVKSNSALATQCSVNTSTGDLSNCVTTGGSFTIPFGITLS